MPLQGVNLPMLVSGESPKLDGLVVCTGCHHLVCRVESYPVDTFLMSLDDVLNFDLGATEDLIRARSLLLHALLFKAGKVPNADSLVERGRGE
jgi:hypothetical protein